MMSFRELLNYFLFQLTHNELDTDMSNDSVVVIVILS